MLVVNLGEVELGLDLVFVFVQEVLEIVYEGNFDFWVVYCDILVVEVNVEENWLGYYFCLNFVVSYGYCFYDDFGFDNLEIDGWVGLELSMNFYCGGFDCVQVCSVFECVNVVKGL